jgi:hypothetical protein
MLKIGDRVDWRGTWSQDMPQRVTVLGIDYCQAGEKYGIEVNALAWDKVSENGVVRLDNGHWAYGYQIRRTPHHDLR